MNPVHGTKPQGTIHHLLLPGRLITLEHFHPLWKKRYLALTGIYVYSECESAFLPYSTSAKTTICGITESDSCQGIPTAFLLTKELIY